MPRIKFIITSLSIVAVLILAVFYGILRVSISPDTLRENVVSAVQGATESKLTYQAFEVHYFPWFEARIKSPELISNDNAEKRIKSGNLKIRFSPLGALFGRVDIQRILIEKGSVSVPVVKNPYLKVLDIRDITVQLTSLKLNRPVKFQLRGSLGGIQDAISVEGQFSVKQWEKWDWESFALDATVNLRNCPLSELAKQFEADFPAEMQKGSTTGHLHLAKKSMDKEVRIDGAASLLGLVYQVQRNEKMLTSPDINISVETDLNWNPESEVLDMKYISLSSPLGKTEVQGRILFGTREVQDVRIMASEIALESLPQYDLFFKEAIPFNFGFSGKSNSEVSINGTLDHLSIHGSWDLTSMLFAYGRYFSKPKDAPANLNFDLLLKDLNMVSGDFSLKFKEAVLKGTFTDLDCRTGYGELNVITNKFSIAGWETYFPPFEKSKLKGEIKILANFKGDLQNPESTEKMLNATFQNVSILDEKNQGVQRLSFQLDAGPVAVYFKDAQFELDRSKLAGEFKLFQPGPEAHLQAKLTSERLEPYNFLKSFRLFMKEWFSEEVRQNLLKAQESLEFFFPDGAGLDNLTSWIEQKNGEWTLSNTQFELYGGNAKIRGGYNSLAKPTNLWSHVDLEHIHLGKYMGYKKSSDQAKLVEGIFFLSGDFSGERIGSANWWQETLAGQGAFSITNGVFSSIDLMGAIANVDELSAMSSFTSGNTSFDDLHSDYVLKQGKISTENLVMVSQNISAKGSGELSLDGLLNYRLDAFLASPLAGKITDPISGGTEGLMQDKLLGPIPFLLSGPFGKPELKTDPARLPELRDNLLKGSAQKVLRNFLPEDFFFKRRANS